MAVITRGDCIYQCPVCITKASTNCTTESRTWCSHLHNTEHSRLPHIDFIHGAPSTGDKTFYVGHYILKRPLISVYIQTTHYCPQLKSFFSNCQSGCLHRSCFQRNIPCVLSQNHLNTVVLPLFKLISCNS